MQLVLLRDSALEIRWTWLPYWLVTSPTFQIEVEAILQGIVLLNGLPPENSSLDRIQRVLINIIERRFPIPGLGQLLRALQHVEI